MTSSDKEKKKTNIEFAPSASSSVCALSNGQLLQVVGDAISSAFGFGSRLIPLPCLRQNIAKSMSQKQSTESHYLLSSFSPPNMLKSYFSIAARALAIRLRSGLSSGDCVSCLIENKLSVDSIFRSVELDSSADQMPVETKNGKSAGGDDDTVVSVSFLCLFASPARNNSFAYRTCRIRGGRRSNDGGKST